MLVLGYTADDSDFTNGIKLTAYETTLGNEHEIQTCVIYEYVSENIENGWYYSYGYTEALWDHKAMLISVKDGVLGLPFFEYSYSLEYIIDENGDTSAYDWKSEWSFNYQIFDIDFSSEKPIATPVKVIHPAVGDYVYPVNRSVLIEGVLYIFSTYHVSTYDLVTKVTSEPIYLA